ncbi:MAG: N-6 DNA methylase [Ruminococcus flavefaciens]|nr:N-6 DNA methylase [Ruminococcus flavefaciens]
MPPFTFDFSSKKPNINYVPEQDQTVARIRKDTGNYCPYPIPTVSEIIKDIDKLCYRVDLHTFMSNMFECGAAAISNKFDLTKYDKREERYKEIMKSYQPPEQQAMREIFGKIYALLSSVVYENGKFADYLGEIFMRTKQGNSKNGQFFTPYCVSKLCAKMIITDEILNKAKNEIITIGDPCCGSGGMLIAGLDVLYNDYNVNYTRNCFIECGDIDSRCVHMAYLQLSLAGVPAIIKHQDALSRKLWDVWKTPAYILQYYRFYKYENLN